MRRHRHLRSAGAISGVTTQVTLCKFLVTVFAFNFEKNGLSLPFTSQTGDTNDYSLRMLIEVKI